MRSRLWRARKADLIWKDWGEELQVVYDIASGDTHALDRFAGNAVGHLQEGALTAEQLVNLLSGGSSVPRVDLMRQVEDLLPRLDRLGLIDPVS